MSELSCTCDAGFGSVLGHTCEGLRAFQQIAQDDICVPGIANDGTVTGCDDENPVRIVYCPWCGTRLRDEDSATPTEPDMEGAR